MAQKIARYIFAKIGIDYDKLRWFLNSVDIYRNHEGNTKIHFKESVSFRTKIKAPDLLFGDDNNSNKQVSQDASK